MFAQRDAQSFLSHFFFNFPVTIETRRARNPIAENLQAVNYFNCSPEAKFLLKFKINQIYSIIIFLLVYLSSQEYMQKKVLIMHLILKNAYSPYNYSARVNALSLRQGLTLLTLFWTFNSLILRDISFLRSPCCCQPCCWRPYFSNSH